MTAPALARVSRADRVHVLTRLHGAGMQDVLQLWNGLSKLSNDEFRALLIEAFPEIAADHAAFAGELGAAWYEQAAPELSYNARPVVPSTQEQFEAAARWALGADGEAALQRLAGTMQRAIFGAARATVVENSRLERGATWARYASANACAFCAMMATRGAVYSTEGAATVVGSDRWEAHRRTGGRKLGSSQRRRMGRVRGSQRAGDRFHDHCRCISVEVRPGQSYEPPDYVGRWEDAYIEASRAATADTGYGAGDTSEILAHMRQILGKA